MICAEDLAHMQMEEKEDQETARGRSSIDTLSFAPLCQEILNALRQDMTELRADTREFGAKSRRCLIR